MGFVVAGLIVGSSRTRSLPPGERRTVLVNILFFVVLGVVDDVVLGSMLSRNPLVRASVLVTETLTLGWFFSPGGAKPASRKLFYVHIAPFFGAVFSGAAGANLLRQWRTQ